MYFYSVNACSEQMLALKDHKRLGVSGNIIPEGSDDTTRRWWQERVLILYEESLWSEITIIKGMLKILNKKCF
jgi:hypothetical protein